MKIISWHAHQRDSGWDLFLELFQSSIWRILLCLPARSVAVLCKKFTVMSVSVNWWWKKVDGSKFPDNIWWPKLTVTWFCIMDENQVWPGDVASRRWARVCLSQWPARLTADWSGRSSLWFLSPMERLAECIPMGASSPLLSKFPLSPISVFPNAIIQILTYTTVIPSIPSWNVCLFPTVHLSL